VSDVKFVPATDGNFLVSSSKDGTIRVWKIPKTQFNEHECCVQTLLAHQAEVWSFDISMDGQYMVSGGRDIEIIVWRRDPDNIEECHWKK